MVVAADDRHDVTDTIEMTYVSADDALSKASAAVATIFFDYEGDEFATPVVSETGRVEINFASNTPDSCTAKS